MAIKYVIRLEKRHQQFLTDYVKSEEVNRVSWKMNRKLLQAKVLLLADVNGNYQLSDKEIASKIGCTIYAVRYWRQKFSRMLPLG